VLGYTLDAHFWGIAYGFASIFVIGALWGGIGGAFMGLAFTETRSRLNAFIGPFLTIFVVWAVLRLTGGTQWSEDWPPLVKYDVDWLAAVSALAAMGVYLLFRPRSQPAQFLAVLALGWCLGFVLLTLVLGLRMTPPRSDNWSGIAGLFVALWVYLSLRRWRAVRLLLAYGTVYGGLGFSIGALFLSMGMTWHWTVNSWRFMEHFFGLLMGFGVGLGVLRLQAGGLAAGKEDASDSRLTPWALLLLFPGVLGLNGQNNIQDWLSLGVKEHANGFLHTMTDRVFGISVPVWFCLIVLAATVLLVWAIRRHRLDPFPFIPEHPLGQGQLLYLTLLWMAVAMDFALKLPGLASSSEFFGQVLFLLCALVCTWLALAAPKEAPDAPEDTPADGRAWRLGFRYWLVWFLVPVVLLLLTVAAVIIHPEPTPGSHYRFDTTATK
jgi:hypothetical protein